MSNGHWQSFKNHDLASQEFRSQLTRGGKRAAELIPNANQSQLSRLVMSVHSNQQIVRVFNFRLSLARGRYRLGLKAG